MSIPIPTIIGEHRPRGRPVGSTKEKKEKPKSEKKKGRPVGTSKFKTDEERQAHYKEYYNQYYKDNAERIRKQHLEIYHEKAQVYKYFLQQQELAKLNSNSNDSGDDS